VCDGELALSDFFKIQLKSNKLFRDTKKDEHEHWAVRCKHCSAKKTPVQVGKTKKFKCAACGESLDLSQFFIDALLAPAGKKQDLNLFGQEPADRRGLIDPNG
jgi:hypothetical protein